MKNKLLSLLAMTVVLFAGSCSYDDTDLQNRVGELEEKVTTLEQTVTQMNTNLKALQDIVNVLNSGDYITEVSEIKAGDDVIGYTISFGKHDPVTIYNGEDGKNGSTPAISVVVGADGKYYWTVNGEILKDATGNDVSAAGVSPLLRINNGVWQYSVDKGASWTDVTVEGWAGVVFKAVTEGQDSVTIELADGTKFEVPKVSEFALIFSKNSYYVANGAEFSLAYTITGADDQTNLIVFPSGDVKATIVKESASAGVIKVVKGAETQSVQIMVAASNGKGQKDYEIINFNELEFTCTAVDVAFEAAAGTATVEMTSNVDYKIEYSEEAAWLTYELASAEGSDAKVLTLNAAENTLRRIRTVSVEVVDEYGYVIETITVAQAAADYPAGGQMGDINILPA